MSNEQIAMCNYGREDAPDSPPKPTSWTIPGLGDEGRGEGKLSKMWLLACNSTPLIRQLPCDPCSHHAACFMVFVGLLAPHPRERSALHPFVSSGDSKRT